MTLLSQYYVPGLFVRDYSTKVPLDWYTASNSGFSSDSSRIYSQDFANDFANEQLDIFYRVVCAPEHAHDDLPLLVFLQGGPGGQGPRPTSADSIPWLADAIKHFRVVLPDQRGTGRSFRVDSTVMKRFEGEPRTAANYIKHFLADSIVRDFDYIRRTEFDGSKWTTLGQSYGGFLTLTYLSTFPEALNASFVCGGIPHIFSNACNVYEHTVPRMIKKTQQYYKRYPDDVERVHTLAQRLAVGDVALPNGDPFSVRRLQILGSDFGMKPSFERMHWRMDEAFSDGDGSIVPLNKENLKELHVTDGLRMAALTETSSFERPLYWTLQEFIYANGTLDQPINWAAHQVLENTPEMSTSANPLMFIGEAALPEMFDEDSSLKPFKPAVDILMQDTEWGTIYNIERLESNDVPLQCAVYFDDMYVDSTLQLDTLSHVGASNAWVTNQFEHDGVRSGKVFSHLFDEAKNRGDLSYVFSGKE